MKKHVKRTKEQEGGIVSIEAPLHVSNVAIIDPVNGCARRLVLSSHLTTRQSCCAHSLSLHGRGGEGVPALRRPARSVSACSCRFLRTCTAAVRSSRAAARSQKAQRFFSNMAAPPKRLQSPQRLVLTFIPLAGAGDTGRAGVRRYSSATSVAAGAQMAAPYG